MTTPILYILLSKELILLEYRIHNYIQASGAFQLVAYQWERFDTPFFWHTSYYIINWEPLNSVTVQI